MKWKKTRPIIRQAYLEHVLTIRKLRGGVFYAVHAESKEYITLTGASIVKALSQKAVGNYRAFISIDGLNSSEERRIKAELKRYRIPYRRVSGTRDEASACIRLADAIAGFIRDYAEGEAYTKELFHRLEQAGIIQKI